MPKSTLVALCPLASSPSRRLPSMPRSTLEDSCLPALSLKSGYVKSLLSSVFGFRTFTESAFISDGSRSPFAMHFRSKGKQYAACGLMSAACWKVWRSGGIRIVRSGLYPFVALLYFSFNTHIALLQRHAQTIIEALLRPACVPYLARNRCNVLPSTSIASRKVVLPKKSRSYRHLETVPMREE